MHEPVRTDLADFIDAGGTFPGSDAYHEVYGLAVPPVRRLPPPAQYAFDPVEAASPDKGKHP